MATDELTVLTEEEQARVRHETLLRAEVQREVDAVIARKLGILGKLNSPFVITFIGGIAVTLATQWFARTTSRAESERSGQRARFEKQAAVLSAFANDFETSNVMLVTVRTKQLQLADQNFREDTYGRGRTELQSELWDVWKLWAQSRKPGADLDEANAYFQSNDVKKRTDAMQAAILAESEAPTLAELGARMHAAQQAEDDLTDAMGREIRSHDH